MKYHMKKLFALALACIVCFCIVAGCTPAPSTNTEDPGKETGDPEKSPEPPVEEYKDTIIFAMDVDVGSMDPNAERLTQNHNINRHIYSTLLPAENTDLDGKPTAGVAESYEQTSDTSYTFKIRQGITFHDGSPLTSADVKFSLERAMNAPTVKSTAAFIASVEAPDDFTVIVNTKESYAPSIAAFSLSHMSILPKAYIEANGDDHFGLNPVGSGPYKFVEWVTGDHITLEAYDGYFDKENMPATKNIIIRIIPESTQRAIALQNGEVDFVSNLSATDLKALDGVEGVEGIVGEFGNVQMMMFNLKKAPFDNYAVRDAITYAIDRNAILNAVFGGYGLVPDSTVAPGIFGYPTHDYQGFEYNVDKAKTMLADAGYPNGFECTLLIQNAAQQVEMATIIQDELKAIGITVKIEAVDNAELIPKFNNADYDFGLTAWNCVTGDADVVYFSLMNSVSQGAAGNRAFVNDPELDALLNAGRACVSSVEERQQIYNDMYDYHRSKVLGYFPICMSSYLYATSAKLVGYSLNVGLCVRFVNAKVLAS